MVSLRVSNVAGQAVRTLIYGSMPGGTFTSTWDGRNNRGYMVPAGIYFLSLESRQARVRTKIVLMR